MELGHVKRESVGQKGGKSGGWDEREVTIREVGAYDFSFVLLRYVVRCKLRRESEGQEHQCCYLK